MKVAVLRLPFLSVGLLYLSCVGSPVTPSAASKAAGKEASSSGSKVTVVGKRETQKKIVDSARGLLGRTQLRFEGATFSSDCSGFVLAAYYLAGIDLRKEYARYEGNGVRRLYRIAQAHNLLFVQQKDMVEGDILFWDNTYDANKDGKPNDELTHVGIVVASYPEGRVDYIHYHVNRGIVQESMNLNRPDDPRLNAPLRIRGAIRVPPDAAGNPAARGDKWLASQLYRAYGRLWLAGAVQ